MFRSGQLDAMDVANSVLYTVPHAGRAAFENVTLIDTGNADTSGIVIGDDRPWRLCYCT